MHRLCACAQNVICRKVKGAKSLINGSKVQRAASRLHLVGDMNAEPSIRSNVATKKRGKPHQHGPRRRHRTQKSVLIVVFSPRACTACCGYVAAKKRSKPHQHGPRRRHQTQKQRVVPPLPPCAHSALRAPRAAAFSVVAFSGTKLDSDRLVSSARAPNRHAEPSTFWCSLRLSWRGSLRSAWQCCYFYYTVGRARG